MISATVLRTVLDSVASGMLIFNNAVGLTGSLANTVAKAAANDVATLLGDADPDVQADLMVAARTRAQLVLANALWRGLGAYNLWAALEQHTGGLNAFMAANNLRASYLVRDVGFALAPDRVMPPVVDPMATFAVTAPGQGTYAHVADIDTRQYGAAWLDLVVTGSPVQAAQIVATVHGRQLDGVTVVDLVATIPALSIVGTAVHLGTLGNLADSVDFVTGVSITGGTAGDAFKVVSRAERVIPATS